MLFFEKAHVTLLVNGKKKVIGTITKTDFSSKLIRMSGKDTFTNDLFLQFLKNEKETADFVLLINKELQITGEITKREDKKGCMEMAGVDTCENEIVIHFYDLQKTTANISF